MRSTYAVPASETCSTATRSCSTSIRCSASRDVAPVLSLLSTMRALEARSRPGGRSGNSLNLCRRCSQVNAHCVTVRL
jgi:hypothetical protein